MYEFSGYEQCTPIYESRNTLVCRAVREQDALPVVLKLLKERYPDSSKLARYRNEFELLRHLESPWIITAHALEEHDNRLLLVSEDFGGDSLKALLDAHAFTLVEWLRIFLDLADALSALHGSHVVHKHINPSNIVCNPATGQCKLIDFGIAVRMSPTNPSQDHRGVLEGTLAYISPEQSGRMNRQLDFRSDLYSLGVTMFELLTGALPYQGRHCLELVHAHMAGAIPSVSEANPEVPPQLSAIVAKLMAKTAEQRYQTAAGLRWDLERCLQALAGAAPIEPFALGERDQSDVFYLPQTLYGREDETKTLLAMFEQRVAARGEAAFLLVSGYAGTGKTSLIKEINKPVTREHGWFIEGKFDQYERATPYGAIKQAISALVDLWLALSEAQLGAMVAELREALGEIGGVLVELVPTLELVIGPQAKVPTLAGTEAQNRFNYACRCFFRCAASAEHPLVVFLDDLQWADLASLGLLSALCGDGEIGYFFLIGAYRDNETPPEHPLMHLLQALAARGQPPESIRLDNLAEGDLASLCADALHQDVREVSGLAALMHRKTLGNAFFTVQFLRALHAGGLIAFDRAALRWQWDMVRIEQRDIPDDVVLLMASKITRLAASTQRLLTLAACIGNAFSLDTLVTISEQGAERTRLDLGAAVGEGLLIAHDMEHYRFSHDRIQQAAYGLMDDPSHVHLRIGRLLLSQGEPAREAIFRVVGQLNAARTLVTDPAERLKLARLNLTAGRRATSAAAYSAAVAYLEVAAGLLPASAWRDHYALSFSIYSALAGCRLFAGTADGLESLFADLLAHARGIEDQTRVHAIRMEHHHLSGDYAGAVEIQMEALRLLGVDIDDGQVADLLEQELATVSGLLGERGIDALQDAPEMADPRQTAIMDILMGLWTSAYLASRLELVAWASCKMTSISLQHGNSRLASFGYMNYAFVCVSMLGRYEDGHRIGQAAIRLAEHYDDLLLRGKVYLLFAVFLNHWRAPLAESHAYSLKAFPLLVENGDWTYASYCAEFIISDATIWGKRCEENLAEARRYLPFLENNVPVVLEEFVRPACLNPILQLLGRTRGDHTFDDDRFEEQAFLRDYQANPLALSYYYTAKLRSLYLFGHLDQALAMIDQADFVASVALAQAKVPEVYFYASLTILAVFEQLPPQQQERLAERVDGYQRQMRVWADNSPTNFLHKHLLVEAERARVAKRYWDALTRYEQAIEAARAGGYINNTALACECAARFLLARDMPQTAVRFLRDAHDAYGCWGASAKVQQLEARYADLLATAPADIDVRPDGASLLTSASKTAAFSGLSSSMDVVSIMQASQSLAREVDLDRLLVTLMDIATVNAGADRCVLLHRRDGDWFVQAETRSGWSDVAIPTDGAQTPAAASVPLSVINYCARKHESVVLGNTAAEGRFAQDRYFDQPVLRSALAVPLRHSGTVERVLYLENSLMLQAFTADHLQVLELLSAQMAIAIDNAHLYRELEHRVEQRTAELVEVNAELQTANERLEALSNLDGLTQIANRRMLDAYLAKEWQRHCRARRDITLILCDIDYFKPFNDTYGHPEGDRCLRSVAKALKDAARRPGDLVARYGGEEFAVVLPETELAGANQVIECIRANIAALRIPHAGSSLGPYLTISLGAYQSVPEPGTDVSDAVLSADRALYAAKTQGRDRAIMYRQIVA